MPSIVFLCFLRCQSWKKISNDTSVWCLNFRLRRPTVGSLFQCCVICLEQATQWTLLSGRNTPVNTAVRKKHPSEYCCLEKKTPKNPVSTALWNKHLSEHCCLEETPQWILLSGANSPVNTSVRNTHPIEHCCQEQTPQWTMLSEINTRCEHRVGFRPLWNLSLCFLLYGVHHSSSSSIP